MAGLQTQFAFTLPKGYVDNDGTLHRQGTMRLATARDEIEPLRDPRISGPEDPFLTILVIARVLTELGTLRQITPNEVEGLFAADLAFLQDLYGIINFGDPADVEALQQAVLGDQSGPEPAAAAPAEEAEPPTSATIAEEPGAAAEEQPFGARRRGHIEEVPSGRSG